MNYIYKITNKINGKAYIGQTITTIKDRMYKHYSHAKVATTGIDYAIQKYGKENFIVEQIYEASEDEDLDKLEVYYIALYDTFNNGYNLTPGGTYGTLRVKLDQQALIQDYLNGQTIEDLCKIYHCCNRTISNILHSNNIKIRKGGNNSQNLINNGKPFKEGDNAKAVTIEELKLTFPSLKNCAQWLIDNNYTNSKSMVEVRKCISRVLTGERKSYLKLHFKYA